MPPSVTLRSALPSDVASIADLLSELNASEGHDVRCETDPLAQVLFAPTRPVDLRALVALRDDTVIATLLYYPGYDTLSASYGFHLADMVVSQPYRRSGVATGLMRELARLAQHEEKSWISLTTLHDNHAAKACYVALGMSQVAVDFFAIGPRGLEKMQQALS